MIDNLLRAWRRSEDPGEYARRVLAPLDFGDERLEVRGWPCIRGLHYLSYLTNVACFGDFAQLDPVAAVPQLRHLELVQNEMIRDLGPLARCPTLRTLRLTSGCQFLKDLSPLAETSIEELSLHLVKPDLGTLRGDRLRRLVIRDPRLADGLNALPAGLPLRELALDNLPSKRNLLGVERWQQLEHVSIRGLPRPEDVRALARLPVLRRLTIVRAAPTGDGRELTLAAVRSALPDFEVVLLDRQ